VFSGPYFPISDSNQRKGAKTLRLERPEKRKIEKAGKPSGLGVSASLRLIRPAVAAQRSMDC
jgi:hypothetical protein